MSEKKIISILDDVIINMTYYYVTGAQLMMNTLHRAAKRLCLDKDLTPEQKKALKDDADFTSRSIRYLGLASKAYKDMLRYMDLVSQEFDPKVQNNNITGAMSATNGLMALNIVMLSKIFGRPENEKKLGQILLEFDGETDPAVKEAYDMLMRRSETMR